MASASGMIIGLTPHIAAPIGGYEINYTWIYAADIECVFKFQAEESCNVKHLGFMCWTASANGCPLHRISLQTIINGMPSGVDVATTTFTPVGPLWNYEWIWLEVASASITKGAFYAIVIQYESGTIDLNHSLKIGSIVQGTLMKHFPTKGRVTGAGGIPIFGYKDDAGNVYGNAFYRAYSVVPDSVGPYGSPVEAAAGFNFPAGYGDYYKLAGIIWNGKPAELAGTSYQLKLYDGKNCIGSTRLEYGMRAGNSPSGNPGMILFNESTLPTLRFGHTYYAAISPDDSAGTVCIDSLDSPASEFLETFPCGGDVWYASRSDSDQDWDDDRARRPLISFVISEWGKIVDELAGLHVKFTPKWNANILVQHADDAINDTGELSDEEEQHETTGVPIGNALESYSGFATVEVFKDPDTDVTDDTLIVPECPIEELKVLRWDPWANGTFTILFRLRAKQGSDYYTDVYRYARIIT